MNPMNAYCQDGSVGKHLAGQTRAKNIVALTRRNTQDATIIRIKADREFGEYKDFTVYNPPRLVLDIYEVAFPSGLDVYQCDSSLVKSVVVKKSFQDKIRFIFYLPGITGVPFQVLEEGKIITITFSAAKDADSTPFVKIVNPKKEGPIQVGEKISFSGTITGGNAPFMCEWVYSGNGLRYSTYESAPFTFGTCGVYEIMCSVTDRDGDRASDSITVHVSDASVADRQGDVINRSTEKSEHEEAESIQRESEKHRALFRKAPWFLSLKAGSYIAGNAEDFMITDTAGMPGQELFVISEKNAYMFSLNASFRFSPNLELDISIGDVVIDNDADLFFATCGPRLILGGQQSVKPYLRAAAVYGRFDWSGIPGDFKDSMGWEAGYGVTSSYSRLRLDLDIFYRDIAFDYEEPGASSVSVNKDRIELSGYSVAGTITCRF